MTTYLTKTHIYITEKHFVITTQMTTPSEYYGNVKHCNDNKHVKSEYVVMNHKKYCSKVSEGFSGVFISSWWCALDWRYTSLPARHRIPKVRGKGLEQT